MASSPLRTLKCPLCGCLVETNLTDGQQLQCPDCEGAFTVARAQVQAPGKLKEGFYRLLIPIGYAVFLIVPLAGIIYYVATQDDRRKDEAAHERTDEKTEKPPIADPPGRNTRPVKKGPVSHPPVHPHEEATGIAVAPFPHELNGGMQSEVASVTIETAPFPHEPPPEIAIAPYPREIFWTVNSSFSTQWETVGAVDVRVAQVTITKYPIFDPDKETSTDSRTPALVLVIEARLNDPKKERSLLSWTFGANHYDSIFLEGGNTELAARDLPAGRRLNTGLTYPIPLPKDKSVVRDVVLFEIPPEGTKELQLRLEAERVKENGNFWFKIPAAAWKK